MPHLCGFYPGICLTTEERAGRNLSQGNRRVPAGCLIKHHIIKANAWKVVHSKRDELDSSESLKFTDGLLCPHDKKQQYDLGSTPVRTSSYTATSKAHKKSLASARNPTLDSSVVLPVA